MIIIYLKKNEEQLSTSTSKVTSNEIQKEEKKPSAASQLLKVGLFSFEETAYYDGNQLRKYTYSDFLEKLKYQR